MSKRALVHSSHYSNAATSIAGALGSRMPVSILVAEDNAINQVLMRKFLATRGYAACIVDTGLAVVQALEQHPYDIVFMDLQMPEMDGLEATRQIVSRFGEQRPVVIAMTASSIGDDRDACFEAGVDDYVCKPLKGDTLEMLIRKWCKVRGL